MLKPWLLRAILFSSLLVPLFVLVKESRWDGSSRLTLVLQKEPLSAGESLLAVFSLEPREERAIYLTIPGDTLLDVPYGYKTYLAASIFRLGELDEKRGGGRLLAKSIEVSLGVLVDGYLIGKKNRFFKLPKSSPELKAFFPLVSLLPQFSSFDSELSLLDRVRLWQAIKKLRLDQIVFWELAKTAVLKEKFLPDGERVMALDKELFDSLFAESFQDRLIRAEAISLEVVNATTQEKLAASFSRLLTNLGAKVIAKTTAPKSEREACILSFFDKSLRKSRIVAKLKESFFCQLKEEGLEGGQADIKIVLGEEFIH